MTTTTEVVYQSVLLANAARVAFFSRDIFDGFANCNAPRLGASGAPRTAGKLFNCGISGPQFTVFQGPGRIVKHAPDSGAGFSATLFSNAQSAELTLGFGSSVATAASNHALRKQLQDGVLDEFLRNAGVLDSCSRIKHEYIGRLHLTGHSLGGLLALWMAAAYPALVARVDTFNSAGVSYHPQALHSFLEEFWDEAVASPLRASGLNPALIHNYYADAGPESSCTGIFGHRPGAHVPLIIDGDRGDGATAGDSDSIARLVEALAVYRLFGRLDTRLTLASISALLEASSSLVNDPIRNATRVLAHSLGGRCAMITDPLALYAEIVPCVDAGDCDGARIICLSATDVTYAALQDTLAGSATRFAIQNLYSFALVMQHAASTANTLQDFSEEYLEHRGYLLESMLERKLCHVLAPALRLDASSPRAEPADTDPQYGFKVAPGSMRESAWDCA